MNWLVIARRDFQDARRSRVLALVVGLFVALVALVMATSSTSGAPPRRTRCGASTVSPSSCSRL